MKKEVNTFLWERKMDPVNFNLFFLNKLPNLLDVYSRVVCFIQEVHFTDIISSLSYATISPRLNIVPKIDELHFL